MNTLLHWLTSPGWSLVVQALLHSLWQGAVVVAVLAVLLRGVRSATLRYRLALGGMCLVFVSLLITWAVLNTPRPSEDAAITVTSAAANTPMPAGPIQKFTVIAERKEGKAELSWTAWLALVWLLGASAMLGRASVKIAGAEHLRRSCRPLDDERIVALVAEARRAVKLTRRIRVAVTDQLTSPAVVGLLVPTLILPLSLVTTLTPEQIRFVLLHELAHIRRGDYLANLFQLLAESLLFFNPAVWWLSHQIRREREACCDALAIELSGAPADYARTLVSVAETMLQPSPTAAPAFGNDREPSSLTDRVHRVLVPGYRPSLRLTWRAMLGALVAGGVLLTLSAIGTRVTVAAAAKLMTPQERIEQIEKKMAEYGQKPISSGAVDFNSTNRKMVVVSGRIRTAGGSPLPKLDWINYYHQVDNESGAASVGLGSNGTYTIHVPVGILRVGRSVKGFAPLMSRLVELVGTNRIEDVDLVLSPGFDVKIVVVDAVTGESVQDAVVRTQYWVPGMGVGIGGSSELKTDATGGAILSHCSDSVELSLSVIARGYEIADAKYDHVMPDAALRVSLKRGLPVSGVVLNKSDHKPLAGATVRLIFEDGREQRHYEWTDEARVLAVTDDAGRFNASQFRPNTRYWLGVSAPGHEAVILKPVTSKSGPVTALLGPPLVVRGRIVGGREEVERLNGDRSLTYSFGENFDGHVFGFQQPLWVGVTNGVGYFQFTNRSAGAVTIRGTSELVGSVYDQRNVAAPIDDWEVRVIPRPAYEASSAPKREVVFRFKHPSGISPRGTVAVLTRDRTYAELEITNGTVSLPIPLGVETNIRPKRTVGYWFKESNYFTVTNGVGPMVVEVSCLAAGAIYVKARNADGTAAGGVMFGLEELKRAPERKDADRLWVDDGFSGDAPRKWVAGPLPLHGVYQIYGSRGNSFCISEPITLTEAMPDSEVELQFSPAQTIRGVLLDSAGRPVADVQLEVSFKFAGEHTFGLRRVLTDRDGKFELENATPSIGEYSVLARVPGLQAEWVKLDPARGLNTIRLKPGLKITGTLVEEVTGYVIPDAEVRMWDATTNRFPFVTARTDAEGRFEFNTLGATTYTITASGAEWNTRQVKAVQKEPVVLKVRLNPGSQLVPVAPSAAAKPITAADPLTGLPASGGTNLYTRSFKVDTNEFARALGMVGPMGTTNFQAALLGFFESLGVDLQTPPKSVFYSDRRGQLLVRSTLVDLDKIERALQVMKEPPPQLNIQAKFIEVPAQLMTNALFEFILKTNKAGSLAGVLTDPQARVFFKALEQMEGVEILSAPEVTTLSGRQAQIQVVDMKTVVTGVTATITNGAEVVRLPQTPNMPFGPVLDVVPYVAADGRSIQMVVIPTVTEFLGYDDPGSGVSAKAPIPHYRVRQIPTSTPNNIPDGQTLVMGGFTSEIVTRQQDGSKATKPDPKPKKRHLLVFITPTIIDPAGNRVHTDEEIFKRTGAAPMNRPANPNPSR